MKTMIMGSIVLAIAVGTSIAYAEEPLPVAQPETTCTYRGEPTPAGAPIGKSALTLLARDPAEGGEVRRDSLIALDVEYRIKDFAPGSFVIMPMFKTVGDGSSVPGGPNDYPPLEAAAGKVHMCVPLAEMYALPTLVWPITVTLSLMKSLPNGSSEMIAWTPSLKVNAADVPEGALARQAEQPPIEYYDNLKKVSNYFESRLARYKACSQRFPERQAALMKAYRPWEARHIDAIELASELQFDFYLQSGSGNTGHATRMYDAVREGTFHAYAGLPVESLRQECARALSEFSDSEDPGDNAISDELAYLKKWRATHDKAKTP